MLKHKHLIVRAEINNPPSADDLDKMNFWFQDLIESIGMKILSGPHTVYCPVIGNRGYTGVCVIETSHIAIHTWDEDSPATIQLDVYTCSELDVEIVFSKMKQFDPTMIDYTLIDRDGDLVILDKNKLTI